MTNHLLIILQIFTIGFAKNSQKYSMVVNTSIGSSVNSLWLIQSYKLKSQFDCLAQCNLKSDCYTAIYSSNSSLLDNCALYSKYFATSEFISFENNYLYFKECRIIWDLGMYNLIINIFILNYRLTNPNIK
jgi:hypothetical protein